MSARVDLHIHSCYSLFDGMMSPRAIVKLANKLDYDAIAVTDHYTYDGAVRGTLAAKRLAEERGLTAYTGLEYHVTEGPHPGHVLVYFEALDQVPRRGMDLESLLEHCTDEGLAVLHPHPFGYGGIRSKALMRRADGVELNGSYGPGPVNQRLRALAEELGLAGKLVANSDAHARGQMGAAWTEVAELHRHLSDTLSTTLACGFGEPKRSWGRAAKIARMIAQPVGLVMNGIQRLSTRWHLNGLDQPAPE